MNQHVSSFVLDEAAAQLALSDAARAHLEQCVECGARLGERRREARAVRDAPYFERAFAHLHESATSASRRWWTAPQWAAALGALAAVVMVAVLSPPPPMSRTKGGPSLSVLRIGPSNGPVLSPGEHVQLSVTTAGHSYALVVGVDESGAASAVWPVGANQSGPVPGGIGKLKPPFEVTPGALTLYAFFSDAPLDANDVKQAVEEALAKGTQTVPPIPGERGRAEVLLPVGASR
jgi:hypothetical protein